MDEYMERIKEYWEIVKAKVAGDPVLVRYVVAGLISLGVTLGVDIPEELAGAIVVSVFGVAAADSRRKVTPWDGVKDYVTDHDGDA